MAERRRRADSRTFIAFGLLVLMFMVGLWRGEENRKDAEHRIAAAAAERAGQLRHEGIARAAAIERSRVDVLVRSCRQQNRNHDKTIRILDRRIAQFPPGRRRDRAERGRAFTVALIEALAPHRDCARRAQRLIR